MRTLALTGLILLGAATASEAQVTANATALASLEVVAGISITNDSPISFGNIAPAAGSITLDNTGARTGTTGGIAPSGTATPGAFTVTGFEGAEFSITTSGTTLTRAGGTETITFAPTVYGNAEDNAAAATVVSSGSIEDGEYHIFVGGTVTVPASPAVGTYSGSVGVTVTYTSI